MSHSIILLPFILAFLGFVLRFYSREGASSMASPSFLLGAATVAIAVGYLYLGVTNDLPPYGELGFGIAGGALMILSIARMFMI